MPYRQGSVASSLLVLVLAGAALAAGCGRQATGSQGEACMSDGECAGGVCINPPGSAEGYCAQACTTSADCRADDFYANTCGTASDGSRACIQECGSYGIACVNGEPVACEVVTDDAYCADCGCADPALRCEPQVGCQPKREVGQACSYDSDCRSDNCSGFAGVCRVPVGGACDATNCDSCLTAADGYAFCSRECDSSSECNGSPCLGDIALDLFWCRPACTSFNDPSCPGVCRASNEGTLYCDCADCTAVEPKRDLGDFCHTDAQCASGDCLARPTCGGGFGDECIDNGFCSTTCANDAACGAGSRCVTIPCAAGQTEGCGAHCLPSCVPEDGCEKAACRALPALAGGSAQVCDVRLGDGSTGCTADAYCVSGRCVDGTCIPVGGSPNGQSCTMAADCASMSCVNGLCKGTGLIGDACQVPADCAVGTCCDSGPSAQRCATGC